MSESFKSEYEITLFPRQTWIPLIDFDYRTIESLALCSPFQYAYSLHKEAAKKVFFFSGPATKA